ncbi:MAG TPA: hypothetical protein VGC79_15025 [Polyangiaceae bacterium]
MNLNRRYVACSLLVLLASCSSDKASAPTGEQDLSNVIYVGGEVTDEALERMLDTPVKNDPRHAATIDSPDFSAPLSKDSPFTLKFHLVSELTRAPGPHSIPAKNTSSKWQRPLHELLQFLAPERIAHAHGAPYNGTAYYLVITDADSKTRLQVFTPAADATGQVVFTPEDMDWQNLVQAPQPLKLEISSAVFEENAVPVDGGPFVGGTFPFRIE